MLADNHLVQHIRRLCRNGWNHDILSESTDFLNFRIWYRFSVINTVDISYQMDKTLGSTWWAWLSRLLVDQGGGSPWQHRDKCSLWLMHTPGRSGCSQWEKGSQVSGLVLGQWCQMWHQDSVCAKYSSGATTVLASQWVQWTLTAGCTKYTPHFNNIYILLIGILIDKGI